MEPLTVAGSVAGMVTAASKMVPLLYSLGSAIKDDSPKLAQIAAIELETITATLQQLQQLIGIASIEKRSLITVEHITATLTGCVMTYSELSDVLESLHIEPQKHSFDRLKWASREDIVSTLVQRLQSHKASLLSMLTIVQSDSMREAKEAMDRLCDNVNEILRNATDLNMRLRNLEGANEPGLSQTVVGNTYTRIELRGHARAHLGNVYQYFGDASAVKGRLHGNVTAQAVQGAAEDEDGEDGDETKADDARSTVSTIKADLSPANLQAEGSRQQYISAFEEDLHRSHVYRHVARSHSQSSLFSDARSTLAFSICSSVTLGEVSNISVYALPVYAAEIFNAVDYTFGVVIETRIFDAPAARVSQAGQKSPAKPTKRTKPRRSLRGWLKNLSGEENAKHEEPKEQKEQKEKPHGIFGVPLHTSILHANVAISLFDEHGNSFISGYVPIVIAKCGVYIKEKGTDVEGIFETSGSLRRLKELQLAFDSPPRYGKGLDWTGYTVHDSANVVLRWLLYLPEPVVPLEFYDRFHDPLRGYQAQAVGEKANQDFGFGHFDQDACIRAYQDLMTELPPLHRQLLLYLLDLLAVFASKSDLNKMTTQKLAAIFQRGLLSHPQHNAAPEESRLSQDILIFLIENQDNFLIGMQGSADEQPTISTTLARPRSVVGRYSSSTRSYQTQYVDFLKALE